MIRITLLALLAAATAPAAVVFALDDTTPPQDPPPADAADTPAATPDKVADAVTCDVVVSNAPVIFGYTLAQMSGEASAADVLAQALEASTSPGTSEPWEQDDFADDPDTLDATPGTGSPWEQGDDFKSLETPPKP